MNSPIQVRCVLFAVMMAASAGARAQETDTIADMPTDVQPAAAVNALTLDRARELLAERSPAIQAAQQQVEQAQTQQQAARALWNPSVNAQVMYQMNDDRIEITFPNVYGPLQPWLATVSGINPDLPDPSVLTNVPDTVLVSQLRHDVRGVLTASQPVYQPVGRPARQQALAGIQVAESGVALTEWQLRDGLEELWFVALRWQRIAQASRQNEQQAQLTMQRAQRAFDAGAGQQFDIERARVALAVAQQNTASAEQMERLYSDQVAVLLDMPDGVTVSAPPELSEPDFPAEPFASWREHPQFVLAEQQAELSQTAIRTALATGLPFVSVSATVTPHTVTDFQDDVVDWYLQGTISWNIWDGGRRRAEANRLEAQVSQFEWQSRRATAELEGRRRQGEIRLEEARIRLSQSREQAALAHHALEITDEAWVAGAASRLDVDAALQSVLAADIQVAAAEVDVQAAIYALHRLVDVGEG
ncbi:MAG: TolC family protein [Myxococcales bacterium]|nr:TolC family protein [Myxococcales bacterium]